MTLTNKLLICGLTIMFFGIIIDSSPLPQVITEKIDHRKDFPLDFHQVVNDASNVFGNVVNKMISKKRILGLDNWYW